MHSDFTDRWVLPWFITRDSSPVLVYYFYIQVFYLIWVANQSVMKMPGTSLRSIWASCWERHGRSILLKGCSLAFSQSSQRLCFYFWVSENNKRWKIFAKMAFAKLNWSKYWWNYIIFLHFLYKSKIHISSDLQRVGGGGGGGVFRQSVFQSPAALHKEHASKLWTKTPQHTAHQCIWSHTHTHINTINHTHAFKKLHWNKLQPPQQAAPTAVSWLQRRAGWESREPARDD